MDQVESLKRRVDARREERDREIRKTAAYKAATKEIGEAAPWQRTDFWCDECRRDFRAAGCKEVRSPAGRLPWAWYAALCPAGHRCIRHITEKHRDRYYDRSEIIRRQRADLADDMLQPDNPRFRHVYPAQWKRMQEARELAEQSQADGA